MGRYQIDIESKESVGFGSSPDMSTSPWLYHISKLHFQTKKTISQQNIGANSVVRASCRVTIIILNVMI